MTAAIRLIGIGQPLRGDDALGLEAVKEWQQQYGTETVGVEVITLESPGLALLDCLLDCSAAIIVDAVRSGGAPGDIYLLSESDLASFGPAAASAHGLGVAETLALGRTLYPDQLPDRLQFIGIEAQTVQVGDPISSAGRQTLLATTEAIQRELEKVACFSKSEIAHQPKPAGD